MMRSIVFFIPFFSILVLASLARAQDYVIRVTVPDKIVCGISFFDDSKKIGNTDIDGNKVYKENIVGSAFYKRIQSIQNNNPEKCGLAKKEYEQDKATREKYDYSSETSRGLRSATSSLASQMSRPNTEAIRRKEAWQRKQALKQAEFRRKQAESRAKRNAMLAEARRLNAEYEACKKRNKVCSRGKRQ